jgi:hypothetical protein
VRFFSPCSHYLITVRYDVALKELIPLARVFLAKLLGGPESAGLELLPVEVSAIRRREPDLVFRSKSGVITHFELQSRNEQRMVLRVAGYGLDLEEKYPGSEIHHFVLYFGLDPLRMPDTLQSRTGALRFHCRMIDIREFSGAELLASESLPDNLLAVLTSDVDQRQAIRQILAKLKKVPSKQRGDHLTQLLIISGMRRLELVVIEEARSVMPIVVDLMDSIVIREIVDQATSKARGEERVDILLSLLRHRFSNIPEWAEARVRSASPADLEKWTISLLDSPATLEQALT